MDIDIEQVKKHVSEFNTLVARRNKAEKWFDEPTTTGTDREKWLPTILQLHNDIDKIKKQLESMGIEMDEFIRNGMPLKGEGEGFK